MLIAFPKHKMQQNNTKLFNIMKVKTTFAVCLNLLSLYAINLSRAISTETTSYTDKLQIK